MDESAQGDSGPTAPELPDIATLEQNSDFSVFMQRGVPDALRKEALRKLWRLDPAFSKLDGLVEYGEDYNAVARRTSVVRTAWRIGRGMAGPEADATEEGEGAAAQSGGEHDAGTGSGEPGALAEDVRPDDDSKGGFS